ncbi:Mg(2+) transport ATPase protein C [Enhygromyxa salina]|uniref:Mg(2+) transport ATPase protein C n=1 Tax=Enhygromyxa salina TaxID=215803 RepID=A0A0C2D0V0_9BACT|nr:MgtC/SapB family protein [Enhygromyxa salina]KIG15470.1 Mg(2+) transport ATPase protein C [Enhygromyxa salina]
MDDPSVLTLLSRLGLAVVCGALLGWDREKRNKPAGLRTHMLVALGAAGFTVLGLEFVHTMAAHGEPGSVDMLRVIQGIIGGVGFLGAGAIIQARGEVIGMTTAAGIWVTAAIGIACGLGELAVAGLLTGAALVVLTVALWADRVIQRRLARQEEHD